MEESIKIVEYKKLIKCHSTNQYSLKLPALIMQELNYDRNKDTFKILLENNKLKIEMIREDSI